MRKNLSKSLFLLIFVIILCSFPSYAKAQTRTFSHQETINYGPDVICRIWDAKVYDDGTTVVRIVRKNVSSTTPQRLCFFEQLSLRTINLDGTVVENDIKLDVPPINYCVIQNGPIMAEFLTYQLIRKNQILVTYYNATDLNNIATYTEWGMIIDFNGNVLDRTTFGPAFINNGAILPNSQTYLNINREKGFFRIGRLTNSSNQEWQQYRVETNGTFAKLTYGIIQFGSFTDLFINVMSTIDEGYAIMFAYTTNITNPTNPLLPQGQLYILPIGYNQNAISPLLLYQTPIPGIRFSSIFCDISFIGVGQICTLTAQQNDPTTGVRNFYIKIDFLSSGSVSSFKVLNRQLPATTNVFWKINSLPYGGFIFTNVFSTNTPTNQTIYGYLFGDNDENPTSWGLPEPTSINLKGNFAVLPNNTLLIAQPETATSWQFLVTDLYRFAGNQDKGYSNFNIESTDPAINSVVDSNLNQISITFYRQVELSDGNLNINSLDGGGLRQAIPGTSCTLDSTGKIVTANVLSSTLSIYKGNYYISMDNNFVKDAAFDEPLIGIKDNIWTFTTNENKDTFSFSSNALLRLTTNGTQYYDSLSRGEQTTFFNQLLDEFAAAVPVSRSRLNTNYIVQPDTSLSERAYLINIGVKETRGNDLGVMTVIKNIGTMVQSKEQTQLGLPGKNANYLDSKYGINPSQNLWEKYKLRLLGVFLVIGLFIALFLFAQRRNNKGNNIAVLQLGIIIFDLVMDVLFVSSNARDVPFLYAPSIIFLTVPIATNTMLAFYIITQENRNEKFLNWFSNHGKVASIFTVLAGADIEALNILHSRLAGFPFFNAPFSDHARKLIFWGACLNIFTEDIPQVIVQVLYRFNTVSYDNIIPLLTLVSSALNLTINIIGRLYQAINRLRPSTGSSIASTDDDDDQNDDGTNDNDEFGGLEEGDTSREVSKTESSPKNYLSDVKIENNEKLGLGNMLDSDPNKNQNKGITFLKRMVSKKQ